MINSPIVKLERNNLFFMKRCFLSKRSLCISRFKKDNINAMRIKNKKNIFDGVFILINLAKENKG